MPSTARTGRAQLHRARSASKEGTWPLPLHFSETARCASTEDHQAPSHSLFREQEDAQATHLSHAQKDLTEDGIAPIQATAVVSKMSCAACQGIESCIQYSIDFIAGGAHVCSIEHYDG